jgi:Phosphotransferase enzyme family
VTLSADADPTNELAAILCGKAGLPAPVALTRLSGGKNNRVLSVSFADVGPVVLKCYHHDPRDGRDRLAAEWNFLAYAAARAMPQVPRPLARDPVAHAGLYTFAAGRRVAVVIGDHVAQALQFVQCLNARPRGVAQLAPGSEACFSLGAHLETIELRLRRLDQIAADAPYAEEARAFVGSQLKSAWRAVRDTIERDAVRSGLPLGAELHLDAQCISPSDFGFHNALADDTGKLTFIDFEYAGRDDPAKLVCDFFCQPEVPVPLQHFDAFANGVIASLGLDGRHRRRCSLLLDAFRIKWLCIMLNDFLPLGDARRSFADQGVRATRCRRQLAKAQTALATVGAR